MKKQILIFLSVLPVLVSAQSIQVGDSVRVKSTTKVYLTGERISKWVYGETHAVSQVGTKRFKHGILLDIAGARSWLGEDDVTLVGRDAIPAPEPTIVPEPIQAPIPEPDPEPVFEPEPAPLVEPAPKIIPKSDVKAEPVVEEEKAPVKAVRAPVDASFHMYTDIGVLAGKQTCGLGMDMIFGAKISPYAFVGGGVGFHFWLSQLEKNGNSALLIPLYADVRGVLPIAGKNVAPFVELGIGGYGGIIDKNSTDKLNKPFTFGFYTRAAVGIEINMFTISLGYDYGPASNGWLGWGIYL